jgi:quercetin dioxygenase-like cupin family protein
MTDVGGLLHGVTGDGVHWTLERPGDLHVNLVHLDAGHAVGGHTNDEVDVVIVVLAGRGRLTIDGRDIELAPHVVADVPRRSRRSIRAAGGEGLGYLSIHRRRGPLGIRPTRAEPTEVAEPARAAETPAEVAAPDDQGGDPACWAHLFEDDHTEPAI